MQFKFFALAAAAFSFGLTAVGASPVAGPAALEKRDVNAEVLSVLQGLQTDIAPLLSQITTAVQGGVVSELLALPLVEQVSGKINDATSKINAITPVAGVKRQSNDDIANVVATLIKDITGALDGLLGDIDSLPLLGGLLTGVDAALNQLLKGLEGLLAGLLNLVATLLVDVAALLRKLAFGLTLGSLGL